MKFCWEAHVNFVVRIVFLWAHILISVPRMFITIFHSLIHHILTRRFSERIASVQSGICHQQTMTFFRLIPRHKFSIFACKMSSDRNVFLKWHCIEICKRQRKFYITRVSNYVILCIQLQLKQTCWMYIYFVELSYTLIFQ